MSKRISFKIGTLFAFALMITLSFAGIKALAAETKVVTVTVPQTVTCPDTAISSVLQSISNSTYSYNDGSYKGTLNYTGYNSLTSTYYASYPGITLYTYHFNVTYSGTVTQIEITTISVTATRAYDIVAPLIAIDSIRQSMASSTYSYDDGSYRGTLSYVSLTNWSQTYAYEYPGIVLYHFTFNVNYAGTATSY
jgi:hypothetical protein